MSLPMLATQLLADFSPETGSAPYLPRTSLDCAESRSFGELHDTVFMYEQLKPGEQAPT